MYSFESLSDNLRSVIFAFTLSVQELDSLQNINFPNREHGLETVLPVAAGIWMCYEKDCRAIDSIVQTFLPLNKRAFSTYSFTSHAFGPEELFVCYRRCYSSSGCSHESTSALLGRNQAHGYRIGSLCPFVLLERS